jgi:hypothetical protein
MAVAVIASGEGSLAQRLRKKVFAIQTRSSKDRLSPRRCSRSSTHAPKTARASWSVGQFVQWQREHPMQACGLEEDGKGLNRSGHLQSNTAVGLQSDDHDARRTFDESPVAPVNLATSSELKFKERRGPGRNWMNQRGFPQLSFLMRVKAYIVPESGCRAGQTDHMHITAGDLCPL